MLPVELRVRNRILPVSGGDGSTLSLDFTTGVLDSRFTFSRSSNATFINSSGYVVYADHNLVRNSTFSSLTGWAPNGTGTTTNADGVLTLSTSAAQTQLYYSQTNANLFQDNAPVSGRVYSASINVTAISGGISYQELITIGGTISNVTRYKDGVLVSGSATASTGLITIVWTSGGANTLRIGISASGSTSYPSASVSMTLPRCVIGSQTQPTYIESPVASTYQAPRFDYDPTTLAPRGLLLEGSATNLALRSDDFNTTVTDGTQWAPSGYTAGTLSTTLPDGTTGNARRISVASGSGSFRSQAITVTANTAYTWSFWARNNGGSQARYRVFNVSGSANIVDYTLSGSNYVSSIGGAGNTSSTWVRVSVPFTTPTGCTSVFVYPASSDSGTVDLLVWGAQLETGSGGASSYISTGQSQVQRASEVMYMDGTNFSAWWPSGQSEYSVYFAGDITRTPATTQFMWLARTGSGGTGTSLARQFVTTTNSIRANNTVSDLTSSLTATVGTRFRAAFAVKSGDSALHVNNGTTTASVTASDTGLATTAAQIVFNPNSDVFQHIASLTFWPIRLPNETLQSLTA
jgi:hypothetical protein